MTLTLPIKQLEIRQGGYYFFEIDSSLVGQLAKQKSTRLVCTLDDKFSFSCGLNHLGNGNFFIILSKAKLKAVEKRLYELVKVDLKEDLNPLGVEMPEILTVFLDQDEEAAKIFNAFTDGKKRSLIFRIKSVKNIDLQIQRIREFLRSST